MPTYLVTGAYAEVVDQPQVYETEVEADSVEEAERLARERCIADNGGDPADGENSPYALTDVFARLKVQIEDLHMGVLDDIQVAAFVDQGLASLHARMVDGAEPEDYNPDLANAVEAACNAWDRVADMLPDFRTKED